MDMSNAPILVGVSSSSGSSAGVGAGGVVAVALVTLIIGVVVGVAVTRYTGRGGGFSSSSSSVKNPTFKNPISDRSSTDEQPDVVVTTGRKEHEYDEGLRTNRGGDVEA
jgi:hypothetical protein